MTFVTCPLDLYNVFLFDHDGVCVGSLYGYSRLEYNQRVNNAWNHQITFELSTGSPLLTTLRSIQDDWFIHIYRTDPVTLTKSLVYEGFHLTSTDQLTTNGTILYNLYGNSYTELLKRRVVVPLAGQDAQTFSGQGETVLKNFVNLCMIAPVDPLRIFPGFTSEADAGTGIYVEHEARYVNLYTVCVDIAEGSGIDFGVYGSNPPGRFYLRARTIYGEDRRETNLAGNPPVIFDIEYNSMSIPILSSNSSYEKNFTYVGGVGTGNNRVIEEVFTAAVNKSPWARKEAFVEARQQTTIDSLKSAGNTYLEENKAYKQLTFDIKQTQTLRWIKDWNLGDLVTAKYFTYKVDKHIIEIKVIVNREGESIAVELEDV